MSHVISTSGLSALGYFFSLGGAQPCLLHVTAHHIHTIAAAQTAIDHQPSSQCRQASWVPPRQGRQPPSGRCALGLPPPSRLPPRCCRLPACASARPSWEVLSAPALAGTRPPCLDRWTPSETPSCPCCQPVSHASISCTAWSCMPYLSMSGPEFYGSRPCLRSYSQARQFHLVRVGSQVSACTFAVISRGRCT